MMLDPADRQAQALLKRKMSLTLVIPTDVVGLLIGKVCNLFIFNQSKL
jgi:hypothetical protein